MYVGILHVCTGLYSILIVGKASRVINGLGKLSLQYILKLCKVKFYSHLLYAANSLLLDLFWLHYGDYYSADDCLHRVFGPRHAAVNAAYEQFKADCSPWSFFFLFFFVFLTSLSFF